jgi:molybdopterin synthase sulfur carrier subunit
MPTVWIPGLLQDLTGGQERVAVPGLTLSQVIDNLEAAYPGTRARLIEEGRLRPSIAVAVDGEISHRRLRHRLRDDSEIHFLPAISGGGRISAVETASTITKSAFADSLQAEQAAA